MHFVITLHELKKSVHENIWSILNEVKSNNGIKVFIDSSKYTLRISSSDIKVLEALMILLKSESEEERESFS